MNRSPAVLLFILITCLPAASRAEATPDPTDTSRIEDLKAALEPSGPDEDQERPMLTPREVPSELLDDAGQAAMRESFKAYYQYRIQGFRHRQRVFEWQLLSSKIIFVVVIFLVGSGIYFSWLQFRADLKKTDGGSDNTASILEASTSGIKVSSPVLGVIILVISLLFFYLYLQYVYPIEEIL